MHELGDTSQNEWESDNHSEHPKDHEQEEEPPALVDTSEEDEAGPSERGPLIIWPRKFSAKEEATMKCTKQSSLKAFFPKLVPNDQKSK